MSKRGLVASIIILIIAGALLFSAFYIVNQKQANSKENTTIQEDICSSDSDCVPASCCHADKCTVGAKAPQCAGSICSMDCAPNTLDCNQGSCTCINKKCEAQIK